MLTDRIVLLGTTILYLLRSLFSSCFLAETELIGSFITQVISHLLLVLLLSVYVNLVKELFLLALFHVVSGTVFPKASAKVLLFSELTKFFGKYFQKIMLFHGLNDQNQEKKTIFGRYEQSVAEMRGARRTRPVGRGLTEKMKK